ncbi:uncharacterized protein LOC120666015 [Panicum virgatum]|uniref:uncharacterized protein LOC120666015 n=1 Tax=Panicum virgatum TaxID=38727 RepID=UPI0019D4F192|nr:uncharacterized protein LOC120666015 [Panicum virgatum]
MSLWGNVRNTVKTFSSSSGSRSSRGSSASQDDMSVDSVRRQSVSREEEEETPASPAVPRNRLKIRVLTMVDQIVARTDYERDALELLKKKSFGHAKRFEPNFLIMMGLKQDVNRAFTAAGWENFADITETGDHSPKMDENGENPGRSALTVSAGLTPLYTWVHPCYRINVTCS